MKTRLSDQATLKGIFLRGKLFWYRYSHQGHPCRVSLQTMEEPAAIARAMKIRENPQLVDADTLRREIKEYVNRKTEAGHFTANSKANRLAVLLKWAERLDFTQIESGWGVFKSSFTAQEAGPYRLQVDSEPYNRHLTTELLVSRPFIEKQGQPVNAPILAEIAALTQGGSFPMADLDKMVSQIALLLEPKPVERRIRLWSAPGWGGAILLLLTIYWAGRKWAGLL